MTEVKHRLTHLELAASRARADAAYTEEATARQQATIDRLGERLTRVERRLDRNLLQPGRPRSDVTRAPPAALSRPSPG